VSKLTEKLDSIAARIRESLSAQDEAREKVLPLCRESIRYSSNAIRAIHRQELDQAQAHLRSAYQILNEAGQAINAGNELHRTGFFRDAQKEYTEGCITLAIITGQQPPDPDELGVESVAYLHGLSDAVGELRRYLLDSMRKGDLSRGDELLSAMDDIYNILVTIDFPDAITGGLRRATDMVRGVLERTRSDLTLAIRQKDLENKLGKFIKKED